MNTSIKAALPLTAGDIRRGASRLLRDLDYSVLSEFRLGNGRRADIAALDRNGRLFGIEIKSSLQDLRSDHKWQDYLDYFDALYFAVAPGFPVAEFDRTAMMPERIGLIIADRFSGEIVRHACLARLSAGRRKAELLRFARKAANRLHRLTDAPL